MSQNEKSVILIVDDVPANIKLMRSVLTLADYEVLIATDGPSAIEMTVAESPDLILLDITMPVMDGYAVCQRLKAIETTRNIPVIFVTARSDPSAEAEGFASGAADFITKPISVPTVLARVKAHLALRSRQQHLEGMFRDVIEFAPDAFILIDSQGAIVRINAQTEDLFGYRRDELIGLPVETLMPKRLRSIHAQHRQDYMARQHRMLTAGVPCLRKDGTEFIGEISLSPLETDHGNLLMAVVRDVTARQQAAQELADSRQHLRALAAQNEAAREGERKHIAREVHDELGQVLTALRMDISLLGLRFGALDPALAAKVLSMKGLADRAIEGVRNVARNLRPSALDMGFLAAIEWLCAEFSERTGVPCLINTTEHGVELDEARAVVVFRIVQESLTNIARYANASQVNVHIARSSDALCVEVADNGQGFHVPEVTGKKSFGLLGMRERALALGGRLDIRSAPGQGTLVNLSIPLDPLTERPLA
ncbi:response regulator [Rhodoferax sp.]|uniref:response regulator n=1 Tax=Rhodoferax sp. TaxID=50421 RepID=UPI001EBE36D9|nr:response regulator [Rhodoferax sp.]MBT9505126.1 response regulator [Rhodoferax sp.]